MIKCVKFDFEWSTMSEALERLLAIRPELKKPEDWVAVLGYAQTPEQLDTLLSENSWTLGLTQVLFPTFIAMLEQKILSEQQQDKVNHFIDNQVLDRAVILMFFSEEWAGSSAAFIPTLTEIAIDEGDLPEGTKTPTDEEAQAFMEAVKPFTFEMIKTYLFS